MTRRSTDRLPYVDRIWSAGEHNWKAGAEYFICAGNVVLDGGASPTISTGRSAPDVTLPRHNRCFRARRVHDRGIRTCQLGVVSFFRPTIRYRPHLTRSASERRPRDFEPVAVRRPPLGELITFSERRSRRSRWARSEGPRQLISTQERSVPHRASNARTPKSAPAPAVWDSPLTSHFSPPQSTEIRRICVRNVEVGGSSPLTSDDGDPYEPATSSVCDQEALSPHLPRSLPRPTNRCRYEPAFSSAGLWAPLTLGLLGETGVIPEDDAGGDQRLTIRCRGGGHCAHRADHGRCS